METLPHHHLIKLGDHKPSAPFSSGAEPTNGKVELKPATYAEVALATPAPAQPIHNQDIGAVPAQP